MSLTPRRDKSTNVLLVFEATASARLPVRKPPDISSHRDRCGHGGGNACSRTKIFQPSGHRSVKNQYAFPHAFECGGAAPWFSITRGHEDVVFVSVRSPEVWQNVNACDEHLRFAARIESGRSTCGWTYLNRTPTLDPRWPRRVKSKRRI